MLDKTLVSIIAMILGGVGLIGAITKYSIPNSGKTVFGQNLFLLKENIINTVVTWFFTIYAMVGLLIQIFFGEILDLKDRIYGTEYYIIAFCLALFLITSLVPLIKSASRWVAKGFWIPEVAKKAKENFLLAKQLFDSSGSAETEPISPKVIQIIDWLEELFEMKSKERDMSNRLSFFEEMFKKY